MGLLDRMRAGDRRALARLMSVVEHGGADAWRVIQELYPYTGNAWSVGITGPPGVGKSTLVGALAAEWRRRNRRVGIIAVDPSSPLTGGAVLGDRIRMHALGDDAGVFIRSMANRGYAGGLARATGDVARVLDAAGFDIILIETVGAGQAEVGIAREAHTTIVIDVPGLGDDVQAIKAGLLEVADIFVVNKADRPDATNVRRYLEQMVRLAEGVAPWQVPVLLAVATRGEHIPDIVDAVERHRAFLVGSGALVERERQQAERDVHAIICQMVLDHLGTCVPQERRREVVERVRTHRLDPYSAARSLWGEALGVVDTT